MFASCIQKWFCWSTKICSLLCFRCISIGEEAFEFTHNRYENKERFDIAREPSGTGFGASKSADVKGRLQKFEDTGYFDLISERIQE